MILDNVVFGYTLVRYKHTTTVYLYVETQLRLYIHMCIVCKVVLRFNSIEIMSYSVLLNLLDVC